MSFKKFNDFLQEREIIESNNTLLNRTALNYDRKLAQFNSRFDDPKQADDIVRAAGYRSVSDFVVDRNSNKWSKLRIPGQGNYVR